MSNDHLSDDELPRSNADESILAAAAAAAENIQDVMPRQVQGGSEHPPGNAPAVVSPGALSDSLPEVRRPTRAR